MKKVLIIALLLTWMGKTYGNFRAIHLKGVSEFQVLVEELSEDAKAVGLTEEILKTDVELKLRKAGLPVKDAASSHLYVNAHVSALRYNNTGELSGYNIYSVSVEFRQNALIGKDRRLAFCVTTWDAIHYLAFVPERDKVKAEIRETLSDQVDEFINDYLTVNPIERTTAGVSP